MHRAIPGQGGVGPPAHGGDPGTHRHAGAHDLARGFHGQAFDGREGRRDAPHTAGQQPVGAAQHRVLFVDGGAHAGEAGGEHGRHRGVAAEADHGIRCQALQQGPCLQGAPGQFRGAAQAGDDTLSGDGPGTDTVGLDGAEVAAQVAAPAVGDQGQADTAPGQLGGQGLGREHVPAGAAGGQHHQVRPRGRHPNAPRWARTCMNSCPCMLARWRVSARTMPMAKAMATVDDPP